MNDTEPKPNTCHACGEPTGPAWWPMTSRDQHGNTYCCEYHIERLKLAEAPGTIRACDVCGHAENDTEPGTRLFHLDGQRVVFMCSPPCEAAASVKGWGS